MRTAFARPEFIQCFNLLGLPDHIIQWSVRLETSQFSMNVSILNLNYFQGVSYEKK
jgi:hypothetical protein